MNNYAGMRFHPSRLLGLHLTLSCLSAAVCWLLADGLVGVKAAETDSENLLVVEALEVEATQHSLDPSVKVASAEESIDTAEASAPAAIDEALSQAVDGEAVEPLSTEALSAEAMTLPEGTDSLPESPESTSEIKVISIGAPSENGTEADSAAPQEVSQEDDLPTDISPSDWAFEAVSALIQRYDCLAGFPDNTFRGEQPLTRFEFAAAIYACFGAILEQDPAEIEEIDMVVIRRLQEDFALELAGLEEALGLLNERVTALEENQFSRNFKLSGEIALTLADAVGSGASDGGSGEPVLLNRVRLQLSSSVIKGWDDVFLARLTAGDVANGFASELGTNEGAFVFGGQTDNNVTIDRIHYYFSPIDRLRVSVLGNFSGHHFYADTNNPGLEVGGGANGAIFQLAERNPIYRQGLSVNGSGIGLSYKLTDDLKFEAGYLVPAPDASEPGGIGDGLFSDEFSALGQVVYQPADNIKLAFAYLRTFDSGGPDFGATGTPTSALGSFGSDATSNTFGLTARWDITPGISLRAFGGYSDVDLEDIDADADIFTFGGILAFPNLFKEKALGAIVVGAEPYVTNVDGAVPFENDIPLQIQAQYRYPITDRLFITPGFVWLTAPDQDNDNDDAFIGVIRTTFTF